LASSGGRGPAANYVRLAAENVFIPPSGNGRLRVLQCRRSGAGNRAPRVRKRRPGRRKFL